MALAIDEAKKSAEPMGCGCVIAKDGEIISIAHNSQRQDCNATAHAEIKALEEAGRISGTKDLYGCEAFCSTEPCVMCVAAMVYAKIKTVYFSESMSDKRIDIEPQALLTATQSDLKLIKL